MIFSSILFIYYFLPIILLVYIMTPKKGRNAILFVSSLLFYAWGEPKYVWLMVFSIFQGYGFARVIEKYRGTKKAKQAMILSTILSVGTLIYFKYVDFFIENFRAVTGISLSLLKITLPVGISFYTFQLISYVVDVYRGAHAQTRFVHLGAYVAMFPQLIAGPIVRYADIEQQLTNRRNSFEQAAEGIRRFCIGLAKKVLLANQFGEFITIFRESSDLSVMYYWMYILAFSLQIYFDFSGYSDMAIGLGKLLGFQFSENFNYPYISKSITEFWRRWHISLGTWFRDYVYIPLGGNKVGRIRHLCNIGVVWILTGFWHGASWNFALWGLYFAFLLILEKYVLRNYLEKHTILAHIYVIFIVLCSFVIFNADQVQVLSSDFKGLFGIGSLPFASQEALYYLKSNLLLFIGGMIGTTPLMKNLIWKMKSITKINLIVDVMEIVLVIGTIMIVTAYLVDGSYNPFLYFRF